MISQSKNSVIVEHIETKKRMPTFSTHKISSLEDIAIYTYNEEVVLREVFKNIYKTTEGKEAISHKSDPKELKTFFENVLPDYDKDRVYVNDIKKVISWYNILKNSDIINEETVNVVEKIEENVVEK
jgi:hypothetical protein